MEDNKYIFDLKSAKRETMARQNKKVELSSG